jgi:hypothetical protein
MQVKNMMDRGYDYERLNTADYNDNKLEFVRIANRRSGSANIV